MRHAAASLLVVSAWFSLAAGCTQDEAQPTSAPAQTSTTAATADGSGDAAGPAVAEGSAEAAAPAAPEPARLEPLVLPSVPVQVAQATALVTRTGGQVRAGKLVVDIPEGGVRDNVQIAAQVFENESEFGRGESTFAVLGAYRATPWDPGLVKTARVAVQLAFEVPQGSRLELLGWHPQMGAWLVIGRAAVNPDGKSVSFPVRQLGEMIVRMAPVRDPAAAAQCAGRTIRLYDSWPGSSEDIVVGLSSPETRIKREDAFNRLTDFRASPWFALVDFKNEEAAARPDGPNARRWQHKDEDFLMDPNASAAVGVLARLVAHEWVDPVTGAPAARLRITEAFDALIEHSAPSTHYHGRGVDLTIEPVPAATAEERGEIYGRLSRLSVCAGFDYVLFEDIAHVHASVAPAQVAALVRNEGGYEIWVRPVNGTTPWRQTDHRWMETGTLDGLAWSADGRFAVRRGEGGWMWLTPGPPVEARQLEVTPDGLRRLTVLNGSLFLRNAGPFPPPGSQGEGALVDIDHPLPIAPRLNVVAATFREHTRTAEAVANYATLH